MIPPNALATANAETLAKVDDKTFEEIVNLETRRHAPPSVSTALTDPRVARRWYEALLLAKASVEGQLGALDAELAALRAEAELQFNERKLKLIARMERQRASAIRFKSGLEMTMVKARTAVGAVDRDAEATRLRFERDDMIAAIRRHAETCPDPVHLIDVLERTP